MCAHCIHPAYTLPTLRLYPVHTYSNACVYPVAPQCTLCTPEVYAAFDSRNTLHPLCAYILCYRPCIPPGTTCTGSACSPCGRLFITLVTVEVSERPLLSSSGSVNTLTWSKQSKQKHKMVTISTESLLQSILLLLSEYLPK